MKVTFEAWEEGDWHNEAFTSADTAEAAIAEARNLWKSAFPDRPEPVWRIIERHTWQAEAEGFEGVWHHQRWRVLP